MLLPMKVLAALLLLSLPAAANNIIFIMADDLGYMDVGFNNPKTFYDTPALNSLAKDSMVFTAGYAACPVCSPTRSSILTGQYPARTRNTDYFGGPNGHKIRPEKAFQPTMEGKMKRMSKHPLLPAPYHIELAKEHTTLAEALKARGYATMHAGKWHLGGEGSWPGDHGFDVNVGGIDKGGPYGGKKYFSPYGNPNLSDGPEGEHLPDRLGTEVAKFIASNKNRPFFVYLPFYSVHTPLMAPKPLVEKYQARAKEKGLEVAYDPEWPRKNRTVQQHAIYAGMVEAMDSAIGKVLKAVEDNGLKEKTIVIFFSDNGGLSTSEGSPTSNLPYRAGKGWAYEGGVREPCLVSLPGTVQSGINNTPITSTDFYPTLLELCGFDLMPEQHIDGTSFAKILKDPKAKHEREPLFWHYPHWGNQGGIPYSAVREGDWKLIRFHWKKGTELYNLAKDPGELTNIADKETEKVRALNAILDAKLKDTDAIMPIVNPNAEPGFNKW